MIVNAFVLRESISTAIAAGESSRKSVTAENQSAEIACRGVGPRAVHLSSGGFSYFAGGEDRPVPPPRPPGNRSPISLPLDPLPNRSLIIGCRLPLGKASARKAAGLGPGSRASPRPGRQRTLHAAVCAWQESLKKNHPRPGSPFFPL